MQLDHHSVARDLGDDRRGGDRRASRVAVDDAALRHQQIRNPKRIDEHDVR
jgi:hypothetical protein